VTFAVFYNSFNVVLLYVTITCLMVTSMRTLLQVDDIALNFKKAVMDQTFEKNRKRPDDPDFKYDVEVDFTSGPIETCDWDSDGDNGF